MSDRAHLQRERLLFITDAIEQVGSAPVPGTTPPHFEMSRVTVSGMPATGFLFTLAFTDSETAAQPDTGGFTVTPWLYMPSLGQWSSIQSLAGVQYNEVLVCSDVNPGALFFQVENIVSDINQIQMIFGFTEQ